MIKILSIFLGITLFINNGNNAYSVEEDKINDTCKKISETINVEDGEIKDFKGSIVQSNASIVICGSSRKILRKKTTLVVPGLLNIVWDGNSLFNRSELFVQGVAEVDICALILDNAVLETIDTCIGQCAGYSSIKLQRGIVLRGNICFKAKNDNLIHITGGTMSDGSTTGGIFDVSRLKGTKINFYNKDCDYICFSGRSCNNPAVFNPYYWKKHIPHCKNKTLAILQTNGTDDTDRMLYFDNTIEHLKNLFLGKGSEDALLKGLRFRHMVLYILPGMIITKELENAVTGTGLGIEYL